MNALLLTLALVGQGFTASKIDWDARWAACESAGWAEARTAPDCDVYLTPVGCATHEWAPWLSPGEELTGGMGGRYIVGETVVAPRMMTRGILTAYYVTHTPTYRKYIRVRFTMPDGRTGVFIWSLNGPVRCATLYPEPRP